MHGKRGSKNTTLTWTPIPNPTDRFSSGIPHFDQLLGGGFRHGSMALLHVDETVETRDWELLLTPTLLNFLYQSNGVMAVLPSRESPQKFRAYLTQWASRRLFDTRVRVIDYVGEDAGSPFVVGLQAKPGRNGPSNAGRSKDIAKMQAAERAVRGARSRMFLELVAFEIGEMIAGPEAAAKMFLHGIKRTRSVGNLCLGLLRPGLVCGDAVRGMADVELTLHRNEAGLILRGIRPSFPDQLVGPDPRSGAPHVVLSPVS
jgi:GvpD gas vesicle protein